MSDHTPAEPGPRTALWLDQPCELVSYHAPVPSMTSHHHQKPEFLQKRLYGKTLYGPSMWVCSNCHDSIHAWIYWLLGERLVMPSVGRAAKAEAERTFQWYTSEAARQADQ